jgi:hypothetical protein
MVIRRTFLELVLDQPHRVRACTDTEVVYSNWSSLSDDCSTVDDTSADDSDDRHSESQLVTDELESEGRDDRTSIMLQNLPRGCTRSLLLNIIELLGFLKDARFVYVPMDFVQKSCAGYAFVTLASANVVAAFWRALDGFCNWPCPCRKVIRVSWSHPHQGVEAYVERFRNSPLMHPDVPDEIRPALFLDGHRVPFPAPTKRLRAPRLRASHRQSAFWRQ